MIGETTGCEALTAAGLPCLMPAMVGEPWCWSHHPDQRAAANDARKRGGHHSRGADASPPPGDVDVGSLPGRMALVELGIRDTLLQPNTPARSRALGHLIRLAHDLDQQAESEEIREQIAELERLVDQREQNHGW